MNEKQQDEDGFRNASPSSTLHVAGPSAPFVEVPPKRQSLSDIFTIVGPHFLILQRATDMSRLLLVLLSYRMATRTI